MAQMVAADVLTDVAVTAEIPRPASRIVRRRPAFRLVHPRHVPQSRNQEIFPRSLGPADAKNRKDVKIDEITVE